MCERTWNARLNVIDELKLYNNYPVSVPITKELRKLCQNAYHSHTMYWKEEKKNERNIEKRKKRAAEVKEKKPVKQIDPSMLSVS